MSDMIGHDHWLEQPYRDSEYDVPDEVQEAYDEYVQSLNEGDSVVPIDEFLDDWYADMEDEALLRKGEEQAEEEGGWRFVGR